MTMYWMLVLLKNMVPQNPQLSLYEWMNITSGTILVEKAFARNAIFTTIVETIFY
jgi:hypothetical protein